jgi:spore coat protein JB
MTDERQRILLDLMAQEFVVIELSLFLNTHPRDERAIADHNQAVQRLRRLKDIYQDRFGILTDYEVSGVPWSYVNEPWPWEITF